MGRSSAAAAERRVAQASACAAKKKRKRVLQRGRPTRCKETPQCTPDAAHTPSDPINDQGPIQNSPFEEPQRHWFIQEGESPQLREGRRPSIVYPPHDERKERRAAWTLGDTLAESKEYAPGFEMRLVNLLRQRVRQWREASYDGATATTQELLRHWQRDGRKQRLFFAQIEAAETIVFLVEGRADLLQGISVPLDEPEPQQMQQGATALRRYACKMATGGGKTTVMGMLAAWSILNKVRAPQNARFSDFVLVICPTVTIRDRLGELDPNRGESSLYRTRDLVPEKDMPDLTLGRVVVTNWHTLELRSATAEGESARVSRQGQPRPTRETLRIGVERGKRQPGRMVSPEVFAALTASGGMRVIPGTEERDAEGNLTAVQVESVEYVESDTAWIRRVVDQPAGGAQKQNILVFNDEAHHAYRFRTAPGQRGREDDEELDDAEARLATVWIEGLDRINRAGRRINFCVDMSATPYFLGRVGQETNRPFPWVVSDFGLADAIESGMVKVPQIAARDPAGQDRARYFNIWEYVRTQVRGRELDARGQPRPEAVLRYAQTPLQILGGEWAEKFREHQSNPGDDPRPPVFIIVCNTVKLARAIHEWIADDRPPSANLPSLHLPDLVNQPGQIPVTIRVDNQSAGEQDETSQDDAKRWQRFVLDTVGKRDWSGKPPEAFAELARKLDRPLHPPGRDLRCLVSVAMLTEGWDANTVTHIVGLRPFRSQLLCEQVVGRGLRRRNYTVDANDRLDEENARVLGVPFEYMPVRSVAMGPPVDKPQPKLIHALPERQAFEIRFPRVIRYSAQIRNRVTVDWDAVPPLRLEPERIPPEVEMRGLSVNNEGRMSLFGPGAASEADLGQFRTANRVQR